MSLHGFMSSIRSISREFTCIKYAYECVDRAFLDISLLETFGNPVTRKLCNRDVQLVLNEAEKSLMEFLIKCSIKVLFEECIRELEPLEGHLRRLAVLCSDYVRTSCSKFSE